MFGYITAAPGALTQEQRDRYRGCYCGLCRTLEKKYGLSGRLALTYDMTFLVLLLSSLYEPEEEQGTAKCPMHPLRATPWWTTKYTDYAADMNLLLAWWNSLDDWEDEHNVSRMLYAKSIEAKAKKIEEAYPRQAEAIRFGIKDLGRYETGPEANPDRAAGCFGTLMGEIFVYNEEEYWAGALRALGYGLGSFIYMMDACIDYRQDEKHGRPNPLRSIGGGGRSREGDLDLLTMLLRDCTKEFELLPLVQDVDLMRNILYTGVWQKYNLAFRKRDKDILKEAQPPEENETAAEYTENKESTGEKENH